MNSCFNIVRRLPLNNMRMNIAGIAKLIQNDDLRDEFIQKVDQPLGKDIIVTDFPQKLRQILMPQEISLNANITEMEKVTDLLGLINTSPLQLKIQYSQALNYFNLNKKQMMFSKDMHSFILIKHLLQCTSLIPIMMALEAASLLRNVLLFA